MAKPYFHAQSSVKKYGGIWEDYMEIHELMDSSKASFPDNRHRALTHNSWFIGTILPKVFGETFRRKSDNKIVNTRDIGEQHVLEDYKFRFIPTPQDFLQEMDFLPWMQNGMGEAPSSHKKIKGNKNITKTSETKKVLLESENQEKLPETKKELETITVKNEDQISFPVPEQNIVLDGMNFPERDIVVDGKRGSIGRGLRGGNMVFDGK